jgi:hypothetical protein
MQLKTRYIYSSFFLLIFLSLATVSSVSAVAIGTDTTDDVEKIHWEALAYDYQKGDFKDSIDIVSVAVEEVSSNISLSITFQGPPVVDATHLYWVWIAFTEGGEQQSDIGAWFYAGGYASDEVSSFWWIWRDVTNLSGFATGEDAPSIVGNTLSWSTPASYWDDIANSANWDILVWAWTSDNTTYTESIMSGYSYWDYYPNDKSSWEDTDGTSTSDETTTSDGDGTVNGTPGFELIVVVAAINVLPVIFRKKKR